MKNGKARKPQAHQALTISGKTRNEEEKERDAREAQFDWTLPEYQQNPDAFYAAIHARQRVLQRLNTTVADQVSGGVFSAQKSRGWQ